MGVLPLAVKVKGNSIDQVYKVDIHVPELVLCTWVYTALDRTA